MAETLWVVCARRAHTTRPISDCCYGGFLTDPLTVTERVLYDRICAAIKY